MTARPSRQPPESVHEATAAESDALQRLARRRSNLVLLCAVAGQPQQRRDELGATPGVPPKHHVGQDIELLERPRRLEHSCQSRAGALVRAQVRDVAPRQRDRSFVVALTAGYAVQQRRLSGAVGADQARQRAGRNGERNVPYRLNLTERGHDSAGRRSRASPSGRLGERAASCDGADAHCGGIVSSFTIMACAIRDDVDSQEGTG